MIFTLHLSNHCEYLQTMSHLVFSVFCFIPRGPQCEEENHSGINRKEERGKGLSSLQPLYTLALLITFACISMCIFSARAHLRTVCLPLQKNKNRANSFSISMAADNHLIHLAEPGLRGPDRSHWLTYIWQEYIHCKSRWIKVSACRSRSWST